MAKKWPPGERDVEIPPLPEGTETPEESITNEPGQSMPMPKAKTQPTSGEGPHQLYPHPGDKPAESSYPKAGTDPDDPSKAPRSIMKEHENRNVAKHI